MAKVNILGEIILPRAIQTRIVVLLGKDPDQVTVHPGRMDMRTRDMTMVDMVPYHRCERTLLPPLGA